MGIDIRLPNINGKTESEQLAQIKSYLYQFAGQLQWGLSSLESSNAASVQYLKSSSGKLQKDDSKMDFNQIKALIIKSADVVEAFYDEVTKLIDKNNRYAAYSEYGTFVEETKTALYADGTGLTQQIKNVQQIFDTDGNIRAELLVNGHIFSGILEYAKEGEAIVGIEIGQTTTTEDGTKKFNQFARFTAEKLSFYDENSTEVAYISDFKMVITEAWVKGNLELGINSHFVLDTSNGIALRPI